MQAVRWIAVVLLVSAGIGLAVFVAHGTQRLPPAACAATAAVWQVLLSRRLRDGKAQRGRSGRVINTAGLTAVSAFLALVAVGTTAVGTRMIVVTLQVVTVALWTTGALPPAVPRTPGTWTGYLDPPTPPRLSTRRALRLALMLAGIEAASLLSLFLSAILSAPFPVLLLVGVAFFALLILQSLRAGGGYTLPEIHESLGRSSQEER